MKTRREPIVFMFHMLLRLIRDNSVFKVVILLQVLETVVSKEQRQIILANKMKILFEVEVEFFKALIP
jgi:hypothetical protein